MRILIALLLILAGSPALRADVLSSRLRLLLPGDDAPTVNERQFLYQRINRFWLGLEADRIERKRTGKRTRRINDRLRRRFLRRPAADARLADAFRSGTYNDATAALLTALTYERFGLAYEARVDHFRVYLIADPEGTPRPVLPPRMARPSAAQATAFRAAYTDLLRTTVLPDLPRLTEKERDEVFYRHFYAPANSLTLGQLAAFQYYRRAQTAYRAKDFGEADRLLELALDKEEQPAFLVLKTAAALQLRALNQPTVEGDVDGLFAQWAEDPDNQYLPAALLQHFDEKQRLLLARDEPAAAGELLESYLIRAPAGKTGWAADLSNLQQYRLLRHYFVGGRIDLARALAEQLHERQPTDERVRYVLGEILIDGLRRSQLTGPPFTAAAEALAERYPFVRRQDRFVNLLLRQLAWDVRERYEADDEAGGRKALARFTDALIGIGIDEERSTWTLTAFLAASDYHFRQEDYKRARAYADKALGYNPRDPYLLHWRDLLNNY